MSKTKTKAAPKKAAPKKAPPKKAAAKAAPKKPAAKKPEAQPSASATIDARLKEIDDWRGQLLAEVRALILKTDPDVVEEWKWAKATSPGVPVWSHDGILCTGETYKGKVKLTFAQGASLPDPSKLFNSSLEGNMRRAIDFAEGDKLNKKAFAALIKAAAAFNASKRKR
ncbi:MAG: DUF1801 domain-containing protein [Polyangiaceae bacterium]|nr:DUF1801 domain-containing protein [Myxococcales bacterium]MCB9590920.1 DUF1801 domain-containing protein [Polyangiaceae bacterium]MCB9609628.1 DUF1801 domain-containing protein [Polyangiaceae bacterium]